MIKESSMLVFAYSDLGHACLKYLLERGENVVAVYTHENRPGEKIWFPSVLELARRHSIPVRTAENLTAAQEISFIRSLSPGLIFSFYYRNLIPVSVLNIAPLGAFNMHGSHLPKYRGRAPVNWAVLNGEKTTGATLHAMIDKADAGDIVDQEAVEIGQDDTAADVQARVTRAAVKVLGRQIDNLKAGKAPRIPQDSAKASYFGRRKAEDGEIDWNWPAARIHNLVRAVTHPYPGAFGKIDGEKFWFWKTRLVGKNPVEKESFVMTCGDGNQLEILVLQPEQKQEMTGKEYMAGRIRR